jgi:hypothetical protein
MKDCFVCKAPTSHIFWDKRPDVQNWVCKQCWEAPPLRYNPSLRISFDDGKGSISVGHLMDIKSRKVAPDGSVYRDRGSKSIRMGK